MLVGEVASMPLKANWWNRSLFSGVSSSFSTGLPFNRMSTVPRTSAEPFDVESSKARSAMIVACVVPHVPEASFLEARYLRAFEDVLEALPDFSRACTASPVVSTLALSPRA
jgi:hypothetical protein